MGPLAPYVVWADTLRFLMLSGNVGTGGTSFSTPGAFGRTEGDLAEDDGSAVLSVLKDLALNSLFIPRFHPDCFVLVSVSKCISLACVAECWPSPEGVRDLLVGEWRGSDRMLLQVDGVEGGGPASNYCRCLSLALYDLSVVAHRLIGGIHHRLAPLGHALEQSKAFLLMYRRLLDLARLVLRCM